MLNHSSVCGSGNNSFSVRGADASTWGGLQPVYVTTKHKSFCWDQDYTRFKISPEFKQLLELISIDPETTLAFNFKGYRRHSCLNPNCDVEEVYLPAITSGVYHPYRSFKHVSRCVHRILDQIEFLEKNSPVDYLICADLTCPGEISARVVDPARAVKTEERFRRAVNVFLEKLKDQLFRDKRSRLGGFYTIHIWKTQKPLDPHLHIHLQIFNVAYNAREKRFYRFKPMISHVYVKEAWRDALRSQGLWDNPLKRDLPNCYVHYIKLKNRGRVIHRLRYVFRKPIVDLNSTNLYPGDLQGDLDRVWIRHLLAYTPRRVKIGFATNFKRFGYVCRKSFFERCPICGGILQKGDFIPGNLPDLPHFVRDRDGSWVLTDPPPCGG